MVSKLVKLTFILLLTLIFNLQVYSNVLAQQKPVLTITPSQVDFSTIKPFTVNVTLLNVTDLSAWQIKISFNPSILKCTNISIPKQNLFANHSTTGLSTKIDNTAGFLMAFNGLWETSGVNGTGTLCQITFNASNPGISTLTFTDIMKLDGTYLTNHNNVLIPFETVNGYIKIGSEEFKSYIFQATKSGVIYNVTLFTNSTVLNFSFNETLEKIDFYLNGTQGTLGACTISIPKKLLNGTFAILLNGSATYFTISENEINSYLYFTYNHSIIKVEVLITLFGDLNGDRKIDMKDIAIVAKAFGTYPGDLRWNNFADLNNDLKVDMKDVAIIAKNFGKIWF